MPGPILMTANGGFGDVACSTCLLYYRNVLWPGRKVIWLLHPDCLDILKFNDKVDEVRIGVKDGPEINAGTAITLNTAPWANQLMALQGVPYPLIPMHVASPGMELRPWHPYIGFSKEEDAMAEAFVKSLPFPRTVILETICRSGQSSWGPSTTAETFRICRDILGPCNFLFSSKTGFADTPRQSQGFEAAGVTDLSNFTLRQCLPIFNRSHLMVGISSGLSCIACAWQANPAVERVELVHSKQYGTWPMARGKMITATNSPELFAGIETAAKRIKACG